MTPLAVTGFRASTGRSSAPPVASTHTNGPSSMTSSRSSLLHGGAGSVTRRGRLLKAMSPWPHRTMAWGPISLRTELRGEPSSRAEPDWRAALVLELDAGALDRLARDARGLG